MEYRIIAPLGSRPGLGTFDTIFPNGITKEQAIDTHRAVIIDFVADPEGIIYFQAYHMLRPEDKRYHRLMIQHFPFGVDIYDDSSAMRMAEDLLYDYETTMQ